MSSGTNKNTILFSNLSPLVSRQPGMNGRLNTFESSDVSPNMTPHKVEGNGNDSSTSKFTYNNLNVTPYQIAMMNTMFANNHVQNMKFELGSPKKPMKNSTHVNEYDKFAVEDNFMARRSTWDRKKFTCVPKLIIPVACEMVTEEEEKKNE